VESLANEMLHGGGLDNQIMAKPVKALDFTLNHQFADFPLDGVRQSVEDQLFVDTGNQLGT